jgi:hypothetical protein
MRLLLDYHPNTFLRDRVSSIHIYYPLTNYYTSITLFSFTNLLVYSQTIYYSMDLMLDTQNNKPILQLLKATQHKFKDTYVRGESRGAYFGYQRTHCSYT